MLLGVSPFIMKLTESLLSIAFNNQLYRFGGDLAVSVMTIMNSVWQMAQLMTHGFTDGAQPILGYNYGAGKAGPGALRLPSGAAHLLGLDAACAPWPCWPSPPCSCGCSPADPETLAAGSHHAAGLLLRHDLLRGLQRLPAGLHRPGQRQKLPVLRRVPQGHPPDPPDLSLPRALSGAIRCWRYWPPSRWPISSPPPSAAPGFFSFYRKKLSAPLSSPA